MIHSPYSSQATYKQLCLLLPALSIIVLALVLELPWHIEAFSRVTPLLPMCGIYYWTIYRPTLVPYAFLFAFGLIQDVLLGYPLGISSMLLMIFRYVVFTQHRVFAKQMFWGVWLGFNIFLASYSVAQWGLFSLYYAQWVPAKYVLLQTVLTALLYPLMHQLYNKLYACLPLEIPHALRT